MHARCRHGWLWYRNCPTCWAPQPEIVRTGKLVPVACTPYTYVMLPEEDADNTWLRRWHIERSLRATAGTYTDIFISSKAFGVSDLLGPGEGATLPATYLRERWWTC